MVNFPKASVIIPVFNSAKTIKACIRGVLEQDYENLEIIVVDDCSKDNTAEIVSGFPKVKLIANKKNMGPSCARNIGIRNSSGEIIILLDSDSWVKDRTWARRHIRAHEENPGCLIGGGIQGTGNGIIAKAEKYFWVTNIPNSGGERPFAYAHLVTNNLSFTRRIFDKIGGFEERIFSGEDMLFCHQALKLGVKILLFSDIIIFHHDREKIGAAIKRSFKYGQDRLFLKKRAVYKYGFLMSQNPLTAFLFSPILALLGTLRFIIGWWHYDKKVLLYSPILFLNSFFMALGIAAAALKKKF